MIKKKWLITRTHNELDELLEKHLKIMNERNYTLISSNYTYISDDKNFIKSRHIILLMYNNNKENDKQGVSEQVGKYTGGKDLHKVVRQQRLNLLSKDD